MGQFLQLILDNLFKLWPVRIIDVDQQGVLFDRGKRAVLKRPGWVVFCPGAMTVKVFDVAYQQIDCGTQSLTTKDGKSISFSINVGYTIYDAARMAVTYYNFDNTLRLLARSRLALYVTSHTYKELHQNPQVTAREMRRELRRAVAHSGVRIKDVGLDEFVECPQLRLLGGLMMT